MAVTKVVDEAGAAYIIGKIKVAQETADGKVDKVEGKGLSTNDLTDELLEKIERAADAESVYTPKGEVDSVEDLPTPGTPGDIYQVNGETVVTDDGTTKTYKSLSGVVENHADLPSDPNDVADGAVYRVQNPYSDTSTDPATDYEANSLWTAKVDAGAGTVTWENLAGATTLPAGTDFKYTEDDGYVPMANAVDLSEYLRKEEVVPIPVADIEAMFA